MYSVEGVLDQKLLFRAEEVAEQCSVGRTTVFEAMRSGRLRSLKIGAARRVEASAVQEWVESLRAEAAQQA